MFTKKEYLYLGISALVLAFIFGFDDGNPTFVLSKWLTNFLGILILVIIAILFRELIIKVFAKRHESSSEYEIWGINQVWFKTKIEKGIPLGIFIAFVMALLSLGKFFFTAIGIHNLKENRNARVGRKFPHLQYYEEAQILSMGILSSLFLAVLGLWFGRISDFDIATFVNINFYIALFNLLPLSSLDGAKIFFGSLLTYIFLVIFTVLSFVLLKSGIILALIIAFLVAIFFIGGYFYFQNR